MAKNKFVVEVTFKALCANLKWKFKAPLLATGVLLWASLMKNLLLFKQ